MNTNTRRAATLTAALIIAGTLAACGDSESGGTDPAQAVVTDEVGDGGAYGPMDVCIMRTEAAGFDTDLYEDAEEVCNWQRALGEDDFATLYNDSVSEAEQQAAADRLRAVANEVVEQADEALEDEDW